MNRKAAYQDDLKADILHHTLSLAGETGWPGVSTRKIAERLQTSTTAIYHYFGGKDAILIELQRAGFEQLSATVAEAIISEHKPKRQLKAASRAMMQFAREQPERYALMFNLDGAVCQPETAHDAPAGMMAIQQVLSQLTNDDVESVFVHWFAMMQGFIALGRHDCQPEAVGRFDGLIEQALSRFIKGL
jgi:AcrR family transcriptional regulator